MTEIVFGDIVLNVDIERTRAFYAAAPPLRDVCSCGGCRNYEAAVGSLPKTVAEFFSSLGIDPAKPCEVYTLSGEASENAEIRYGGFYHLCGEPAGFAENSAPLSLDHTHTVFFSRSLDLPEADFPQPAFTLIIDFWMPCMLWDELF